MGAMLAKDARECCLICSIPRFTLEQEGGGFDNHIKGPHNPWSYLSFLAALKLGDPDEFTGLQSYVEAKARVGDSTFLPVGYCTTLQCLEREKEQSKTQLSNKQRQHLSGDTNEKILKALEGL